MNVCVFVTLLMCVHVQYILFRHEKKTNENFILRWWVIETCTKPRKRWNTHLKISLKHQINVPQSNWNFKRHTKTAHKFKRDDRRRLTSDRNYLRWFRKTTLGAICVSITIIWLNRRKATMTSHAHQKQRRWKRWARKKNL